MKRRRLQIVEVVWDDITGHGPEWKHADDVATMSPVLCRTVGFLWWRGKVGGRDVLRIVGTITQDCGVGDVNVIPAGVVREIRTLATVTVELDGDSAPSRPAPGTARRRY